MPDTTLTAEQLVQIHADGIALRGDGPFEDPLIFAQYRQILRIRGEVWAASVLGRDLSRRSLTWGPWLERAEAEILVLAHRAEGGRHD